MTDLLYLGHARQCHALVVGDVFRKPCSRRHNAATVVALAEIGNQQAPRITSARVVDYGLEAIADFRPIFALVRGY